MALQKWSSKQILFVLVGSMVFTGSLAMGSFWVWKQWKERRKENPEYTVKVIVQTGPEKEALKGAYLSELLGLSVDAPKSLYAHEECQWAQFLTASPLIASAQVKTLPPSTLYIDYTVRSPVGWISDYKNVGVDQEGHLFPVSPFFSPKEMPEIYLGLPSFGSPVDSFGRKGGDWREPLENRYFQLALELLRTFEGSPWKEGLRIQRIDVSNAFAPSLGRREIVLFTEEEISLRKGEKELHFRFPKILRLAPRDYAQQLQNFFALRKTMVEDYKKQLAELGEGGKFSPRIVDLRLAQLAFIENR